jgi:hypothetical protein
MVTILNGGIRLGCLNWDDYMLKKSIFLCGLISSTLYAQEEISLFASREKKEPKPIYEKNEPSRKKDWECDSYVSFGYRRDRQKFDSTLMNMDFQDRNSLQLLVGSEIEWRHLIWSMRGSYGWLINGNTNYVFAPSSALLDQYHFGLYDLGAGYNADVRSLLGYRIELYDRPSLGISFIPLVGYQYSHMMNYPKGNRQIGLHPLEGVDLIGYALSLFSSPNQQDWFGPFLEGRVGFRFWQSCEWDLFYQYHWMDVRSKSSCLSVISTSIEGFVAASASIKSNVIFSAGGAHKQLGGTDFKYRFANGWHLGFHFEGSVSWKNNAQYKENRMTNTISSFGESFVVESLPELATIHWVSYEANIAAGCQF